MPVTRCFYCNREYGVQVCKRCLKERNKLKSCSRVDCGNEKLHGSKYCNEHALMNFRK